jgi:hypothetical protein
LTASRGNRLRDAVVEQQAIRKIRHHIVLRRVRHLHGHGARCAHIVEDNHCSDDPAGPVVDRRGRIFNRGFESVASDQDAIKGQTHGLVLFDRHLHGISCGLAREPINDSKHFGQWPASGFFAAPPRHRLGDQIEIGDVAGNVRTENGVTNGVEGYQGAFFFYV